jgi:hypothetical protein
MRIKAILFFVLTITTSAFVSARGQDKSKLALVHVEPPECVLQGMWSSQTFVVMGRLADGAVCDLTSEAEFKSANTAVAQVDEEGVVTPVSDGRTAISIMVSRGDAKIHTEAHVTVKDSQKDSVYFRRHVMPLVTSLGCNAAECHGSTGGGGGLRLSMFAADPEADYAALTKAAEGRQINKVEPLKSLLLAKVTASIPHGGGQKVQVGSGQYNMLVSWIAQGARWSGEQEPQLVSIKVYPEERILRKGETQQLLVTAIFSDGTQIDVTRDAQYQSPLISAKASPPGEQEPVATISQTGQIRADNPGQSTIIVVYMRKYALVRVVVPFVSPPEGPPGGGGLPTLPDLAANNGIDEFVLAKLKELGIPPCEPCSDHEFLRRVFLDVIGTLPTADEARAFLSDSDPQKRAVLIDRLLQRDEFADYWALKWGDLLRVKSEYPSNLWPNAVQAYHHWIRDSIAQNKPYDQFARELLVSSGSNFRSPPVNFYRAFPKRDPQSIADATALVFMGARIGCARCHAHPVEEWTIDDNLGMAAFFAKVGYKKTLEWKEEIVYFSPKGVLHHPGTQEPVKPTFLGGETLELDTEADPRVKFAEWLTAPENPWFAKNIVNRIWFWLLGWGIVNEPDDLRPTNPPQNPELLAYLERELIDHDYDLKHIFRLILNSRTYSASAWRTFGGSDQWKAPPRLFVEDKSGGYFSHYPVKRLTAEQFLDAIGQVTETSETFSSRIPEPYTFLPPGHRAVQLADGSITTPFLELFGRPSRDTAYESERSCEASMRQALHLINSRHIEDRLASSPKLKRLMESGQSNAEIVEEIYLSALSRFPSEDERQSVPKYFGIGEDKKARSQAIQDFVWAILNTKEFMFNH